MTVSQESTYTEGMSWKDFMTEGEMAELKQALTEKQDVAQPIIDEYNAVYRKLKTRCDARMRRAGDISKEDQ